MLASPAGKGRSGTLACSYLLTLEEVPTDLRLERSHTRKEWARKRASEMMAAVTSISEHDTVDAQPEAQASRSETPEAPPIIGTTLPPKEDGFIVRNRGEDHGTIQPGDNVKIEQDAELPLHSQPHTALVDGDQTGVLVSNSPASHSSAVSPIVTPATPSRTPASPGHELGMTNDPMANNTSSLESYLSITLRPTHESAVDK